MKKHAITVHGDVCVIPSVYLPLGLLYKDKCKTEQAGLEKTGEVLGSSLIRVTALVIEVSMVLFGPFRKIALGPVSSKSFIVLCWSVTLPPDGKHVQSGQ
jgi:hypothetical protein